MFPGVDSCIRRAQGAAEKRLCAERRMDWKFVLRRAAKNVLLRGSSDVGVVGDAGDAVEHFKAELIKCDA